MQDAHDRLPRRLAPRVEQGKHRPQQRRAAAVLPGGDHEFGQRAVLQTQRRIAEHDQIQDTQVTRRGQEGLARCRDAKPVDQLHRHRLGMAAHQQPGALHSVAGRRHGSEDRMHDWSREPPAAVARVRRAMPDQLRTRERGPCCSCLRLRCSHVGSMLSVGPKRPPLPSAVDARGGRALPVDKNCQQIAPNSPREAQSVGSFWRKEEGGGEVSDPSGTCRRAIGGVEDAVGEQGGGGDDRLGGERRGVAGLGSLGRHGLADDLSNDRRLGARADRPGRIGPSSPSPGWRTRPAPENFWALS